MGRGEKSIDIKAPPEKAWEMLAFDRLPEWMDSMKSVARARRFRVVGEARGGYETRL